MARAFLFFVDYTLSYLRLDNPVDFVRNDMYSILSSLCLTYLLSLFLLITNNTLQAQTINIQGRVTNAVSGLPLANANITSSTTATQTNTQGDFTLVVVSGDSLQISFIGYETVTLVPTNSPLEIHLLPTVLINQVIVVNGGLTAQPLDQVATSVTVFNDKQWQHSDTHIQNLTTAVPNLNWAGGTSRPRYFQIRGIGERSQFAGEGAPNFSVGFVMDDVDLSGLGTAGILFDLDQVEVFKGPQSTNFGPNAMAGLISLQSANPSNLASHNATLSSGNDGLLHFAGTINIPINSQLAIRAGYHQSRTNGFHANQFLHKKDTNRRHENLGRLKVRYFTPNGLALLGTFFRAHLNNGYDGWSSDNNKDLFTYTDKPGKDNQLTTAYALRGEVPLPALQSSLISITSFSTTELEYSYDGDWGNDAYWLASPFNFDPASEGYTYDFFDRSVRQRETITQELRLLNTSLGGTKSQVLLGAYIKNLQEQDQATGYLFGGDAAQLTSNFEIDNLALYGQYSHALTTALRLALNLRAERHTTSYNGTSNADNNVRFNVTQWLLGGKSALTYTFTPQHSAYASISRGYRAGGINQHPRLASENRPYDPEYIINMEIGYRAHSQRSTTGLTLFYALRSDQQVNLSSQQDSGDPNSFFFFIANAAHGRSSGLELEQTYQWTPRLQLTGSLGYLFTHIDPYQFSTGTGKTQILGDRDAAHAPRYSARVAAVYEVITNLKANLALSSTDTFFYSDSHNQKIAGVSSTQRQFNLPHRYCKVQPMGYKPAR